MSRGLGKLQIAFLAALQDAEKENAVLLASIDAIARAKAQVRAMADGLRQLEQDVADAETALADHYRATKFTPSK